MTKEIETIKKNQSELLEMKNTMDEIKKNLDSLNNKTDNMEDQISNLEDILQKCFRAKGERTKTKKK